MTTLTNRGKLLAAYRRELHARSEGDVRTITRSSGLSHSSFNHHFSSQEALSLAGLELHFAEHDQLICDTLRNDDLPPQQRIRHYFMVLLYLEADTLYAGCLMGKLCTEFQDLSQPMRDRLAEMLLQIQRSLAYCLSAANKAGILPRHSEADELAGFILATLHGAMAIARAQQENAVLLRCQQQLLQMLGW